MCDRTAPIEDLLATYKACLLIAMDGPYDIQALDISAQQSKILELARKILPDLT
jgi:hypothetical protein